MCKTCGFYSAHVQAPKESKQKKILKDDEKKTKMTKTNKAVQEKRKAAWRLNTCRLHLAERSVHSRSWQSLRCKSSVLRGAPDCPAGGWKKLMDTLLSGKLPEDCKLCMKLLGDAGFDMEALMLDLDPATTSFNKENKDHSPEEIELDSAGEDQNGQQKPQNPEKQGGLQDVLQLVRDDRHLQLLDAGTHKRQHPVRCLRCVRSSTKKNAVFDLITLKKPKWYWQHVNCATHKANVAVWNAQQRVMRMAANGGVDPDDNGSAAPVQDLVLAPCQGLSLQKSRGTKLYELLDVFKLWFAYNSAAALASMRHDENNPGHTYNMDVRRNDCIIIHGRCKQENVPVRGDERPVCSKCKSLAEERSIRRMIGRFWMKHAAARALAFCQLGVDKTRWTEVFS